MVEATRARQVLITDYAWPDLDIDLDLDKFTVRYFKPEDSKLTRVEIDQLNNQRLLHPHHQLLPLCLLALMNLEFPWIRSCRSDRKLQLPLLLLCFQLSQSDH